MTILRWANQAYAHLDSAINSTQGTMTLVAGEGRPWYGLLSGGDAFYLTLFDASGNLEVVQVTGMSGDTFSISRGQLASIARAWPEGTILAQRITSACLNAMLQRGAERSGTINPHGVLTGLYVGEKYYDTVNVRHFICLGGTNWKLLTGSLLASETYDDDGFPVVGSEYLLTTADNAVGGWSAPPLWSVIDNGIEGPGAAPTEGGIICFMFPPTTCKLQLAPASGTISILTIRAHVSPSGNPARVLLCKVMTDGGTVEVIPEFGWGPGQTYAWPTWPAYTEHVTYKVVQAAQAADLSVWFTGNQLGVMVQEFEMEVV